MASPFAIYVPAGELRPAVNPFGRTLANRGLFRALALASKSTTFVSQEPASVEAARDALGLDSEAPLRLAQRGSPGAVAAVRDGTIFAGDPFLELLAWERRKAAGDAGYSLIGLAHTLAPPETRRKIALAVSAPVQPWDAIVCTSPSVRTALGELFDQWDAHVVDRFGGRPAPRPQTPVIPLGADVAALAAQAGRADARAALRAEYGLGQDDVLVLWVGRLSFFEKAYPQPMFLALEEAVRSTAARVVFAMAGWFPNGEQDRERYVEAAKAYAPSVEVVFEDGNDRGRVADLWAGADIFLSLVDNIQETFGLTPVEAMASGLPVVVSDWDGYRSTVRHGQDGFLIPTLGGPTDGVGAGLAWPHVLQVETYQSYVGTVAQHTAVDVARAAEALARLIASSDLRRRMGESGRAWSASRFDWSHVAAQILELGEELKAIRNRAEIGSAGKANPFAVDPFVDFRGFATSVLSPELRLRVRSGATMSDLVRAHNVQLDRMASYRRAAFADVVKAFGLIERGEAVTVADVAGRFPADLRDAVRLSLIWMCKLGLLVWEDGGVSAP